MSADDDRPHLPPAHGPEPEEPTADAGPAHEPTHDDAARPAATADGTDSVDDAEDAAATDDAAATAARDDADGADDAAATAPSDDAAAAAAGDDTATSVTTGDVKTRPTAADVAARRRARRGRVRTAALRTLTAAAVLAVTGGVAAAGTLLPAAQRTDVPFTEVSVPPPAGDLVCPGPVRVPTEPEPGDDVAYDPQFDPSPSQTVSALRAVTVAPGVDGAHESPAAGTVRALGGEATVATVTSGGDAGAARVANPESSLQLHVDPSGTRPAWAAAALMARTDAGDLRGLVAASCQVPSAESWLVGGSTSLGSSARLALQNPGRTPATVHVELWGPAGPVELAGAPEFLVPPGSERVVLLEGVAAEQKRVVVHLTSTGGLVTGYLQDSELRGLVPAGVDYVVTGQAPAEQQVVAGLSVTATDVAGADTAQLRLLAPGDRGGRARISLLGAQGRVELPGTDEVTLEPGAVLDVPLGGLAAGAYTAVVEADVPVVAGALVTRGEGVGLPDAGDLATDPVDRAWAPSVAPGTVGPLAVPEGVDGSLLLAVVPGSGGSAAAPVEIEAVGRDGAVLGRRELDLAAGATTALPITGVLDEKAPLRVSAVAAVVVRTQDPRVVWSAVLVREDGAGDMVAVLAPVAPRDAQPEVGVRVR